MKFFVQITILFLFLLASLNGVSQTKDLWTPTNNKIQPSKILQRSSNPEQLRLLNLDLKRFKQLLVGAPLRTSKFSKSKTIVSFPDASGKLIDFSILEASVMAPELAKKFPDNKSYIGQSVDDESISIRFSVNQLGVYAMLFKAGEEVVYIDPYTTERTSYMVYRRADLLERDQEKVCLTKETEGLNVIDPLKTVNANDAKLRTFRLALAATAEYSQFHISQAGLTAGTDAQKKAAVMAAMTTTMTRVNGVFEKDVALTMVLVANNDNLIYLNSITDPYTDDNSDSLINENQTNIDAVIGSANYDIGHVFSTGGGGVAMLNSPCSSSKAQGVTGQSNPVGDAFDIDFVAHEMGHQFGATHTFNGDAGSCSGNRTNSTAVEPGSGSTIMAYAGICSPQNVQQHSDAYFHSVSIQQMFSSISIGSSSTCTTISTLTNNLNVPVVDAGADVTIPKSTPFMLTAVGSDADNDNLTYAWEQTDTQITTIPPSATATGGAVFRSVSPKTSAIRYFPAINTVLTGQTANTWEVVPSVARTLTFDVTVRDNVSGGGQTAKDIKTLTVDTSSGPFVLTSQNTAVTYDVGSMQTVTWDVANTNVAPVNTTHVAIFLSIDGGQTYPISLASSVVNNGSYDVLIPNNATTTARIMVAGVDNVFFNVNTSNFTIQENSFALLPDSNSKDACTGDSVIIDYTYQAFSSFSEITVFSASNLPSGVGASFNPTSTSINGTTVQLTLTGITDAILGSNTINVIATAPSTNRSVTTNLQVYSASFDIQTIISPSNGSLGVDINPTLSWTSQNNAKTYEVQVSSDSGFNTIVSSVSTESTSYALSNLTEATTYYWRVRAVNPCGIGAYSTMAAFATYQEVCNTTTYTGAPVSIPDNSATGATSTLSVADNVTINAIKIGVNISNHTWIGDIKLDIISPANKTVKLLVSANCSTDDMNAVFDDNGSTVVCNGTAPGYSGTIKPVEVLSLFKGDNAQGTWTLFIEDQGSGDFGNLVSWSVEVCSVVNVPLAIKIQSLANFKMWPNPTNDLLNISLPNPSSETVFISIIDVLGRTVKQFKFDDSAGLVKTQISLDNLSKGMYYIKIVRGNNLLSKRIILF